MWTQTYTPVADSLPLSVAAAAIPLVVMALLLAVWRAPAWRAATLSLAAAFAVALFAYGMPLRLAVASTIYGAGFGLFPIGWLVYSAILLFDVTVDAARWWSGVEFDALAALGPGPHDLTALAEYCRVVSESTGVPIPHGYPVVGKDAFETSTGVHAAAIVKALRKGDAWLADRVYSAVPAADFGREQVITVGPMSGRSNAAWWLERHGIAATPAAVDAILKRAKSSDRVLSDEEIREALKRA